jgi:hypothetical protein
VIASVPLTTKEIIKMKAEITYNAGKSYRIKATKFEQGKTKIVTDPGLVKRCQQTAGFCVRVLEDSKPVKVSKVKRVRPVEKPKSKTSKFSKKSDKY